MSTLEQQCEEIRKDLGLGWPNTYYFVHAKAKQDMKTLFDYIEELKSAKQHLREGMENLAGKVVDAEAELRRPVEAKEIAEIQERAEETAAHCGVTSIGGQQAVEDRIVLLRALAESQRECARQMQWSDEQSLALQSIAMLAEENADDLASAKSNDSPSEIAKSIKFRLEQLQVDVDKFRKIALRFEHQLDKSQQLLRESQPECARLQTELQGLRGER